MRVETKYTLIFIVIFGSVFFTSFSTSYADSLETRGITAGGTNSTSSGFSLISTVGDIAGYFTSSGFQLFSGFLATTQGGNAIPTNLFSGVAGTVGSDGKVTVSLTSGSSGSVDFTKMYAVNTVNNEDQITTDRDFSFTDGGIGSTTLIPAGTTITADTAAWNGQITIPQSISTLTAGGVGGATTLAISIGSPTIDFTLNHPIRITFGGLAGNLAAVIGKNSVVTEITTICNGVDFATVDAQLGQDEACKTVNNRDLVVWTKRLSTFISFVPKTGAGYIDVEGPSFTQNFAEGETPLVIGSTVFPKLGFYNERTETATVNKGTQVPFKLLMSENSGPQNVQHVALYMNLYGSAGTEAHKSDTWLVFEKDKDVEIHDPHGFITDAYASTATKDNKFETLFYITFAKPMQTSNLIIVAWDNNRNGITSTVLDAFKVIDPQAEAKKQQKGAVVAETLQKVQEKEAVVAETLQKVQEKELAVVAAISKYGFASTEAKVAQEALDKAKAEAKVAQEALDKAKAALDEVTKESTTPAQTQEPKAKEPTAPTPEPGVDVVPEPGADVMSSDQKEIIQKWAGFHVASASDSDLLSALNIKTDADSSPKLPKWTKNTLVKWTLDEKISMKEFVNAIKYFVKK